MNQKKIKSRFLKNVAENIKNSNYNSRRASSDSDIGSKSPKQRMNTMSLETTVMNKNIGVLQDLSDQNMTHLNHI